jgi:hypothetical protein
MTAIEKKLVLEILDDEWQYLRLLDLKDKPSLIQYAAAVWTLLEIIPSRDRFLNPED